jgi:predicted lipid-binding transport protein (Tim44 family)
MRRPRLFVALALAALLAFAPGLAFARAGSSFSFGSRGSRTYMAPPSTSTAPFAAPVQRSLTPQPAPSYAQPSYAQPGLAGPRMGFGGGSPFMTGLLGGFIGAGIGGLLFGHGMFGGISGFGGMLGFLIQIFLVVLLVRWLFRMFFGATATVGGGNMAGRMGMAAPQVGPMPAMGTPSGRAIQITPGDYQAFEQLLTAVQAAWSAHDLNTLRAIATPEMVSYFAEQLGEQTSRGVRNTVTNVHLDHGDLAEAWAEDGREYATVAMRFSMTDVTRDDRGAVVDGSLVERITATEIWTFMRVPGGRWVLSAIQQAR